MCPLNRHTRAGEYLLASQEDSRLRGNDEGKADNPIMQIGKWISSLRSQ